MNKGLPEVAKVHRFVNLYKEFDADDEELTRTRKIRRAFVEQRYKDIVETIYDGKGNIHMDTTITYEDGREVKIKADMDVADVPQGVSLMEFFLQLLITGILVGSIYALVALGWTLIYKCSGVLNLAMGELTLIGAYVCLTFYQWGIPFILALVFTLVVGFALGLLTETSVPATDGGRTGFERYYGNRRTLILFQRGRRVNLGNGYGCFYSHRYFPWSLFLSERS